MIRELTWYLMWIILIIIFISATIYMVFYYKEPQEQIDARNTNEAIYNITHSTTDCKILQEKRIEIFNLGGRADDWRGLYIGELADYVKEKMEIIGC